MRAARAGTSSPALVALALLGCTALKPGTDVRRMDAGQGDAGRGDAGRVDASPPDAGADAATDDDAGRDAGGRDGGPPPAIEQLALGARHTCARDALGRVICWGDNRDGQLRSARIGSGTSGARR